MADSLNELQNTANQTLGDVANNTGSAPTTIGTAQSLGASQNASQMVGTPQQSAAALKEALSPKDTLSELMRTATGRVQAKKGQSTSALENLENAKALSGLAGKLGEATTQAVVKASIPLDVAANLDSIPANERDTISGLLTNLTTAIKDGGDVMSAYKALKEKGYTQEQIAKLFNVDAETLWGKVESSLPANIRVADLAGVANEGQLNQVRSMLTPEELTKFDNMSWQEAKQLINQKLNDSMADVNSLKRQAQDKTLPDSTRAIAVQRLRELGMTGEFQAAQEIETAQSIVEDADNVYIDGQAYEVADVLRSPEAKALVQDILSGEKDISALKGTPFEGLTDLITQRSEKLAEYFGIEKGQVEAGAGRLAEIERTRKANEEGMNTFFSSKGLTPTTDTNVLKALGITEDMQKGYTAFDPNVVNNNPVLNAVLGITDPTQRALTLQQLAIPGADVVIQNLIEDDSTVMIDLLVKDPRTAGNLIKASNIAQNAANIDTAEELNTMWSALGVSQVTMSALNQLSNINVGAYGVTLPTELDSSPKDGIIDSPAALAKNMQGKTPEQMKAALDAINKVNLPDIVQARDAINKTTNLNTALNDKGVNNYWEDGRYTALATHVTQLLTDATTHPALLVRNKVTNELEIAPGLSPAKTKAAKDILTAYTKGAAKVAEMDTKRAQDKKVSDSIPYTVDWRNKHGNVEATMGHANKLIQLIRSTKNPNLRAQAHRELRTTMDFFTSMMNGNIDASKTQRRIGDNAWRWVAAVREEFLAEK